MAKEYASTAQVILRLIEDNYGSDAAFERAANLPAKTVSNWRRGLSSSYMKMLPTLCKLFSVTMEDLLLGTRQKAELPSAPVTEEQLLQLLQQADALPTNRKNALYRSLWDILRLYLMEQ